PRPEQTPWPDSHVAAGWPGRTPVPLGAPVYSEPGVDEDDDPARDDGWGDDRWADDLPPIRPRPAGLMSPDEPDEMPDGDTLLFDDRPPGSRPLGSRRAGSRRVSSPPPGPRRARPGRPRRRPLALVRPGTVA